MFLYIAMLRARVLLLILILLSSRWDLNVVEGSARFDHRHKRSSTMETSQAEQSFHAYGNDNGRLPNQDSERLMLVQSFAPNRRLRSIQANVDNLIHSAALGTSKGKYYGAKASFSVHEIKNMSPTQSSGAQIWISSGDETADHDYITAGWLISYHFYNDYTPRLTTTINIMGKGGCFNSGCGFIQVSNSTTLGMPLDPSAVGEYKEITLELHYDEEYSGWWLDFNNEAIGYWPGKLFASLSSSCEHLKMGGIAISLLTEASPGMGTGVALADPLWGNAAYVRNIQIRDESKQLVSALGRLNVAFNQSAPIYVVTNMMDGEGKGVRFFYGGPGGHNGV